MADQSALTTIKQHILPLETILTGAPAPTDSLHSAAPAPIAPQAAKKRSKYKAPSVLTKMKASRAAEAAQCASLSHLIDTSIEQTEALLTWPKAERTGRPSGFDTAFRDLFEAKEEMGRRLEEYERRARVLKMKLEVAKIAVITMGKEVAAMRATVETWGDGERMTMEE